VLYYRQGNIPKSAKGRVTMLKSDFFKKLKQTNVSESPKKTTERLKDIWKPLPKPEREEILALCGLKKTAVERAYTTGNVSAKIVAAFAQVLSIDPYYLSGKSDEQRPYDDALLIQFLTELNYKVGKSDIVKRGKAKPETPAKQPPPAAPQKSPGEKPEASTEKSPATQPSPGQIDFSVIFNDLCKLNADSKKKLDGLTEENLILLLKSLTVQADFSEDKKNRFALVKYLLLM
jgi:hypothetical protein